MVKDTKFDLNPSSLHKTKHYHIFVKFFVSFLLIGLAFRLFVSDSFGFSSVAQTSTNQIQTQEETNTEEAQAFEAVEEQISVDSLVNQTQLSDNDDKRGTFVSISATCDILFGFCNKSR